MREFRGVLDHKIKVQKISDHTVQIIAQNLPLSVVAAFQDMEQLADIGRYLIEISGEPNREHLKLKVLKNQWREVAGEAIKQRKAATQLLRDLADLQNGPPLERDREEWEACMEKVWKFLQSSEK